MLSTVAGCQTGLSSDLSVGSLVLGVTVGGAGENTVLK